jgi:hypothetical protein
MNDSKKFKEKPWKMLVSKNNISLIMKMISLKRLDSKKLLESLLTKMRSLKRFKNRLTLK